jgi:AcrR family transcriptional regulator
VKAVIDSTIEPDRQLTSGHAGTDRRPEVTPKQDRSRANREALLDALMDLLYERPYADIGVADISRRAGMTTGAVYGRFGDKRGVAIALHERFAERASQTMEDWGARPQWAAASPQEIISSWTRGAINFGRMYRPLLTLMANDPLVREQHSELMARPPRILARLLKAAMPEVVAKGLERDVEWAARAALAVLEQFDLDDDELYERIEVMLRRLIGVN